MQFYFYQENLTPTTIDASFFWSVWQNFQGFFI